MTHQLNYFKFFFFVLFKLVYRIYTVHNLLLCFFSIHSRSWRYRFNTTWNAVTMRYFSLSFDQAIHCADLAVTISFPCSIFCLRIFFLSHFWEIILKVISVAENLLIRLSIGNNSKFKFLAHQFFFCNY